MRYTSDRPPTERPTHGSSWEDSSNDRDTGGRKRKHLVAGTAGPAVLVAFAAGRDSERQPRFKHHCAESKRPIVSPISLALLIGTVAAVFPKLPGRLGWTCVMQRI